MKTTTTGTAPELSSDLSAYLIQVIDQKIGIQLTGKEYLIASRLQPLVQEFGVPGPDELVNRMKRGDRRIEAAVIDSMTTNETSFFRDLHPFETLAKEVMPSVLAKNGSVKIWNGACSSGQESYTLAMLISEHFPNQASSFQIQSTDVSPAMVKRTTEATYSRFEINRGLPANLSVKYFDKTGRNWTAKPNLKAMVRARELNLLGPYSSVGKCDIVLLRNVLIYFTPDVKRDIIGRIRRDVLKPGGCLLLGASETTSGIDPEYESRKIGQSIFYFTKGA
jgi:chemotaxis protein methyltransferase CheR